MLCGQEQWVGAEQLRIAGPIDKHARRVYSAAAGSVPFLVAMSDYMDDFKRLMNISLPKRR